ncbi:MAG: helix-turn-helix domain-containing protein [Actinomycetales bacterium]|nr:helix-turn-helix domain-containing protein [Actinomycetales bacterium]
MQQRFLTLADVAEVLNITMAQTKALVRTGALPAVKIGGRGIWRVESSMLEDYIERMYAETREAIARATEAVDAPNATGGSGTRFEPDDEGTDDAREA